MPKRLTNAASGSGSPAIRGTFATEFSQCGLRRVSRLASGAFNARPSSGCRRPYMIDKMVTCCRQYGFRCRHGTSGDLVEKVTPSGGPEDGVDGAGLLVLIAISSPHVGQHIRPHTQRTGHSVAIGGRPG